ncbi:MAG TPA: hypothetical protein VIL99_09445 [Ignavibacteria bacterium]
MKRNPKTIIIIILLLFCIFVTAAVLIQFFQSQKKVKELNSLRNTTDSNSVIINLQRQRIDSILAEKTVVKSQIGSLKSEVEKQKSEITSLNADIYPASEISVSLGNILLFKNYDGKNFYYKSTTFKTDNYSSRATIYFVFKSAKISTSVILKGYKKNNYSDNIGYLSGSTTCNLTKIGTNFYYGSFSINNGCFFIKLYEDNNKETYIACSETFSVY